MKYPGSSLLGWLKCHYTTIVLVSPKIFVLRVVGTSFLRILIKMPLKFARKQLCREVKIQGVFIGYPGDKNKTMIPSIQNKTMTLYTTLLSAHAPHWVFWGTLFKTKIQVSIILAKKSYFIFFEFWGKFRRKFFIGADPSCHREGLTTSSSRHLA